MNQDDDTLLFEVFCVLAGIGGFLVLTYLALKLMGK